MLLKKEKKKPLEPHKIFIYKGNKERNFFKVLNSIELIVIIKSTTIATEGRKKEEKNPQPTTE